MHRNKITGPIPSELGDLSLTQFLVHENELNGEIPEAFFNNKEFMTDFRVDNNMLEGDISPNYANMVMIEDFRVGNNSLSGEFGDGVAQLTNLSKSFLESFLVHMSSTFVGCLFTHSPVTNVFCSQQLFSPLVTTPSPELSRTAGRTTTTLTLSTLATITLSDLSLKQSLTMKPFAYSMLKTTCSILPFLQPLTPPPC